MSALVRKATQEAVDETLQACVAMAQSLVRVDTGRLQSDITYMPSKSDWGGPVTASWGAFTVPYAIWQEIGTFKMTAQPFLRPSADHEYPQLTERIRRRIRGG